MGDFDVNYSPKEHDIDKRNPNQYDDMQEEWK